MAEQTQETKSVDERLQHLKEKATPKGRGAQLRYRLRGKNNDADALLRKLAGRENAATQAGARILQKATEQTKARGGRARRELGAATRAFGAQNEAPVVPSEVTNRLEKIRKGI